MSKTNHVNRIPRAKGIDMASFYSPKECGRKAKHIVFSADNERVVEEFITILGMKDQFAEHDVPMPNKMVMFGPPGTGKTLTAFHLAHRLQLPLVLVRLDAIIHSHLGETGSNVRKLFEYARANPCVLFLDEFDAVGRTRESNDEVKEMARVVNTLLQCLDEFEGDSILVAATNLETQLDHAIWRRFDTKMTYGMPDESSRRLYISKLMGQFEQESRLEEFTCERLTGCSYADVEQIVLKAKRKAIIANIPLHEQFINDAYAEYKPRVLAT
ncbi:MULTISPECIES: AAA family ATPase [Paenibacillus]|uniref:AAA family ATPase n=1 Tax=Paenibacillus TaxID=44249 RepID=UPI000921CC11|nr:MULTISPECIES: ATP-binding protein [Paenibacillus]WDQ31623.1 ATP-binding protein [Paenibacillus marchantiae]SHN63705.1 ATPase family associated with various cellular activities (AAA) [Paenibacillus sp. ov031]SLJ90588.1 ATPase family associated with various cellular activities (AAA) [Paenibacillus sp. RU5A]SOC58973.1 ATPase family associated with various cellular activities (AAA) [Paenibacillus sp. RU26A]SOC68024.1 ATPase family associated with various cellular activities (AAA) [Paenibacillus